MPGLSIKTFESCVAGLEAQWLSCGPISSLN